MALTFNPLFISINCVSTPASIAYSVAPPSARQRNAIRNGVSLASRWWPVIWCLLGRMAWFWSLPHMPAANPRRAFPPDGLTITHLTLYRPMDSSIKLQTIKLEIFRGHRLLIINKNVFHSLKNNFVLANSADPDEMLHYSTFYLGLHSLPKYLLRVIIFYSAPSCASQPISLHRN